MDNEFQDVSADSFLGSHEPVMVDEVLHFLNISPSGNYIDCTLGGGGHSIAILDSTESSSRILACEVDIDVFRSSSLKFSEYSNRIKIVNDSYVNVSVIAERVGFSKVDGIIFDLGVSSMHLDVGYRGFSIMRDGPLDMRFNLSQNLTAYDVVNSYNFSDLEHLLRMYGGEKKSRQIAREIIQNRPISSTIKLASVISKVFNSWRGRIHPATKSFQAIRIEVNHELKTIENGIKSSINLLKSGGRLCVIAYHSLEVQIIRNIFREATLDCLCPRWFPVCRCDHNPSLKIITQKAVTPTLEEVKKNPRCRSASLRVAEHI